MRSVAPRRWRRMFISSDDARSAISSSEMMALVISVSIWRRETSPWALLFSRGVFSRSVSSAARAERAAASRLATVSRAFGDRVAPFSAREMEARTSSKATRGEAPRYCKMTVASSVSCCHISISGRLQEGVRLMHSSAPMGVRALDASRSRIFVNSRTRRVLSFIITSSSGCLRRAGTLSLHPARALPWTREGLSALSTPISRLG